MNVVEFLRFFYSYSRILSLREMAFLTALSDRTIRTIIADANDQASLLGCHVELIRSIGYQLIIDDTSLFTKNVLLEKEHSLKTIEFDILNELFMAPFIKIDDLCAQYYVSKGTINKTIKHLKEKLSQYNLQILAKPYLGLYLNGDEHEKRKLMVDTGIFSEDISIYQSGMIETFIKYEVYFNQNIVSYLSKYLGLIQMRQKEGAALMMIDAADLPEKAIIVAEAIFNSNPTLMEIPYKEICYFANILTMMVILPSKELENMILEKLNEFNQIMKDKYQCDLKINKEVYKQFLRHLLYLHKRISSYYQYTNIGFDYYSPHTSFAYELALELIAFIFPDVTVYAEEIGMISLYMSLFLENAEIKYFNKNIKIVIAVPRYDLTAEMFISIFQHDQTKEEIKIFTYKEKAAIRDYQPDIILSYEAFKLEPFHVMNIPLPMFQVCDNGFLKSKPIFVKPESYLKERQQYRLLKGVQTYFKKEHYLAHQKIKTVPQILQHLSNHVDKYQLLENPRQVIDERIEMGPIVKRCSMAVLCPHSSYAEESRVIFYSFKEAIVLKKEPVVYLLMVLLYKNDADKKDMLLLMSALFDELEHIVDIYEQDTYEDFIQYIKHR